jgi:hypothetical protein
MVPLIEVPGLADPCTPQPTFFSRTEFIRSDACLGNIHRRRIFEIGPAYDGPVFTPFGPDCFEIGKASDFPNVMLTVGPEIPATEFAPMKTVRPN